MPKYIYPPHPHSDVKIMPDALDWYEKQGQWIAQLKFQGSRASIKIQKNIGLVEVWNRHGTKFKNLVSENLKKALLSLNLNEDKEYWLDGELLHNKAKSKITNVQAVTNTIVLFDVLYVGENITNLTQLQRLDILKDICTCCDFNPDKLEPKKRAFEILRVGDSAVWMAETFYKDFSCEFYRFFEFDENGNDVWIEIEGLVLKNKNFKLQSGLKEYDVNEIIRCRKTKPKMYLF